MGKQSLNIRNMDRFFLERLLDVIDDIENRPLSTLIRRRELRRLLESHGCDYRTVLGRTLIEELYLSIYCNEE